MQYVGQKNSALAAASPPPAVPATVMRTHATIYTKTKKLQQKPKQRKKQNTREPPPISHIFHMHWWPNCKKRHPAPYAFDTMRKAVQHFHQIIIWVYTESLVEAYKQSASTISYITKPELRAFLQASFITAQYLSFTVRSGEVVVVRQESGMNAEHYWLGWFFTESRLREKG